MRHLSAGITGRGDHCHLSGPIYCRPDGDKTYEETLWNLLLIATSASAVGQAAQCDRTCLDKMVDSYLAALVAHDPAGVPLAANVRFVENTVPMKPGHGLWKTASAIPSTFKIYVPDPSWNESGFWA